MNLALRLYVCFALLIVVNCHAAYAVDYPATLPSLVGWWDAQQLSGSAGQQLNAWADKRQAIGNTTANPLIQVTGDLPIALTQADVKPTLQSVSLNGHTYNAVRFSPNSANQYDLFRATDVVSTGDTSRTIIAVYRGGHPTLDQARIAGFGSQSYDASSGKTHWNLAGENNGSQRFDGAAITTGYGPGLDITQFVIRTAVMNSASNFDDYGNVLTPAFTDNPIMLGGTPNNPPLGNIVGDFFVGDLHSGQLGGGAAATTFDFLEVLVFDTALTPTERQGIQNYLTQKYTSSATPTPGAPLLSTNFDGSTAVANNLSGSTFATEPGITNISSITGDHNFRQNGQNAGNLGLDVNFNTNPTTGFEFDFSVAQNYEGELTGVSFDVAKTSSIGEFNTTVNVQGWTITVDVLENGVLVGSTTETFEVAGAELDFTTMFFPEFDSPITLLGGNTYTIDVSILQSQTSVGHYFTARNLALFGTLAQVPEPVSLFSMCICGLGLMLWRFGFGVRRTLNYLR